MAIRLADPVCWVSLTRGSRLTRGTAFLRLAGVLIDDVRGDGLLLLLLLPHQQDTLMDEDVLLLHRRKRRGRCCECRAYLVASRGTAPRLPNGGSPRSGPWTGGANASPTPSPEHPQTRVLGCAASDDPER